MKSNLPYTWIPIEKEKDIVCNYLNCAAGTGLAGNGQCFRKGDPFNKNCPRFISDEEFEVEQLK